MKIKNYTDGGYGWMVSMLVLMFGSFYILNRGFRKENKKH